jgi:hypothetical protein
MDRMESTPRVVAAGVRAEWSHLPRSVRAAIEELLGSPVVSAANQAGGFSPGMAARVRCRDGSRAFVKACGTSLNPRSPSLYRDEAAVTAALPGHVPVPRLRHVYDDGDWVVLVYDEVDGRMPHLPWRVDELRRALTALTELSRSLTPSPVTSVPTLPDMVGTDLTAYTRLAAGPPADLAGWERRHLDRLADVATGCLQYLAGDSLLHLDVRADNILFGTDGRVYFVDWPWACTGPAWVDTALLLVNAALYGHDPESLLDGHRLFRGVDPWHVTAFLVGLAGMFSEAWRQPPPPGIPTVREFQRVQAEATLRWVRRRTGWR